MLLAKDGRSWAPILLDPAASRVEQFAASELRDYLRRITGAEFCIEPSGSRSDTPCIVVASAASELGRASCPTGAPADPESFLIQVQGGQLQLIGADDRGTLYAVYSFLEEDCGVFWLAPSDGQEFVPSRPALALLEGTRRGRPALPIRAIAPLPKMVTNVEIFKRYIDFAPKVGLNTFLLFAGYFGQPPTGSGTQTAEPWNEVRAELLPEFQKRGIILDIGHHCWDYFIDPKVYFAEHPEWFSLVDGERTPYRQICLASDEVLQEFERNVRAYLRSHPEIRILSLFPNDQGPEICQCEHCRHLDTQEAALGVVNRIAAAMEAEFPGVRFGHLTYSAWGEMPPAVTRPRPNVVLYWAAWHHCLHHGYYSPHCNRNRIFRSSLDGWRRTWPNPITVYDFYTTSNHSSNTLLPFGPAIAANARALHAHGFEGLQTTLTQVRSWWTYALNLWLFGKLTWDPKLDPARLLTDWVRAAYPTTWPQILRVYQRLQEVGEYEAHYLRADITARLLADKSSARYEIGSIAELDAILRTLDECQSVVAVSAADAGSLEADYLRRLSIVLRYTVLRCRWVRAIVGTLAALQEGAASPSVGARASACQSARRWLAEMSAAANAAVALLEELGDGVEGVLHDVWVLNWARPTRPHIVLAHAQRALEKRLRELEGAAAAQ